jgi:hypothetical protein
MRYGLCLNIMYIISKSLTAFLGLLWAAVNDNEINLSLKLRNVICGPRDRPYLTFDYFIYIVY